MSKTPLQIEAAGCAADRSTQPSSRYAPKKMPRADSCDLPAIAESYIQAATAASTRRNFASDLRHLASHGISSESEPAAVLEYLAKFAGIHAVGTLERRMISLHKAAKQLGSASVAKHMSVISAIKGIKRTHGARPRRVTAVVKDTLLEMLICGEQNQRPVAQVRDKALLLVGFCGALRRSEVTALEVSDITFLQTGMDVLIRKSKTDAEGNGETIFLPCAKGTRCPIQALKDWLALAGIEDGPIFRAVTRGDRVLPDALSPQSVALIVKRAAARTGANADDFSGHSLRAGFCTEASTAGLANWQIRAVSRHVNDVHLATYVRPPSNKTPSLL